METISEEDKLRIWNEAKDRRYILESMNSFQEGAVYEMAKADFGIDPDQLKLEL